MANHKSAIKRHRQSLQRALRNKARRTRVRNVVKDVRAAISEGNREQSVQSLRTATSVLDKAAAKGAIHWKTAARKVSRLTRAVNAVGGN